MLWLSLANAYEAEVHNVEDFNKALVNSSVTEIVIHGLDLTEVGPLVLNRDLTISGNDAVVLPPLGIIEAHVTLNAVSVVGATSSFQVQTNGGQGAAPTCDQQYCTLLAENASLVMDGVTIDDAEGTYALQTTDSSLTLTNSTISNHPDAPDYSVLVTAEETHVTVTIENLTFTGNSGPFKVWNAGDHGASVTVKDSTFSENLGETEFVSDLYLWGVGQVDIQGTTFRDSKSSDAVSGALALQNSSGSLTDLTFQNNDDANTGGVSLVGDTDASMQVTIEGIRCEGTVMNDGGCLFATELQFLQVNNLEAYGTVARDRGGAVAVTATDARFEAGEIRESQALTGGGVFHDGGDLVLSDLRICRPEGENSGAALHSRNGYVEVNFTAIQSPTGGSAIYLQNTSLQATNVTSIAGDDDFLNGTDADVLFDNSIFHGQRAFQLESGTADLRYNLFSGGANLETAHGEGFLEGDPGFSDTDPTACDARLIPATHSPAVDGNPTEHEVDGTGVRDLGWYWGQEWAPSEDTDGDSGVQNGFTPGPASGGCGHAPLAPIALLGVALAATRRRC